jgi:hypothetical protein
MQIDSKRTPSIVVRAVLENKTGPQSIVFRSVPDDRLCRISVYVVCAAAGSAGILACSIGWTDPSGAVQTAVAAANLAVTVLGTFSQGQTVVRAKASTDITLTTLLNGALGAPQYHLYAVQEVL